MIADLRKESAMPMWPQVLPGATQVLLTVVGPAGPNAATIETLSLSDGQRRVMVRGGTFGRFLSNGYLTYVNQGAVFAVPFDLNGLVVGSAATPVLDDVSYSSTFGFAQLAFSETGMLVYRRSADGGPLVATWLDASGRMEPLLEKPGRYTWPRLSPDGQRLALSSIESGTPTTLIYDARLKQTTHVTSVAGNYGLPIWSPDGQTLVLGGPGGLGSVSSRTRGQPTPVDSKPQYSGALVILPRWDAAWPITR